MKEKTNLVVLIILIEIIVLPIAIIPLVNAQEGQVTLNPTDDTHTDSYNTDSNYGGQPNLIVSRYEYVGINYEKIVWLKFNLSDVPDGAVVDVATLELLSGFPSETYNVYVHQSSDISWTELTLTYSNMPSFNATAMDVTVVATAFEWYNWSVVDAVRNAVDGIHGGPDVVTIVLLETALHGAFSSASFYSKEQVIYVPKLTVHWTKIIPEFPTWTSILLILTVLTVAIVIYKRGLPKALIH